VKTDTHWLVYTMVTPIDDGGVEVHIFIIGNGHARWRRNKAFPAIASSDEVRDYLKHQNDEAAHYLACELGST